MSVLSEMRSRLAVVEASKKIQPCLPTVAASPPSGPDWIHEIKHDGYRMMIRRDAAGTRLITRGGFNWSSRYPLIAAAANALKARSFVIDGEAVACDANGLVRRAEVIIGLKVAALQAFQREPVERDDLIPSQIVSEASAHSRATSARRAEPSAWRGPQTWAHQLASASLGLARHSRRRGNAAHTHALSQMIRSSGSGHLGNTQLGSV